MGFGDAFLRNVVVQLGMLGVQEVSAGRGALLVSRVGLARSRGSDPRQRVEPSRCSRDATVQQCANYNSPLAAALG